MKKVRITVMCRAEHPELSALYENPGHSCDMKIGQTFLSDGWHCPEGLCESAWQNLYPFVFTLAHGGKDFFDGWMKDPNTAMISCNDGFRPVSYLLEAVDVPEN